MAKESYEEVIPAEVAMNVGADDELAQHYICKIVEGAFVDEAGYPFISDYGMVMVFYDGRNNNTIAVVPFDKKMRDGIEDPEFDFFAYLIPGLRRRTIDYMWYLHREEWDSQWPLRQYLEAWHGVLTGSRSYESFVEACQAYGVRPPVVWGEAKRTEAFIARVSGSGSFYHFMQACEDYGFYPEGHHKRRQGTWKDVIKFGMRLAIALTANSMVGGGGRSSTPDKRSRGTTEKSMTVH